MSGPGRYDVPLDQLESGVKVPLEEQVEEQPTAGSGEYVAPEDLDRARLLGITGAGRLKAR